MKIIIAGSRGFKDYDLLCKVCRDEVSVNDEIVSGAAPGADRMGERYAVENDIPFKQFPALWHTHGKTAGFIRNEEMAEYADMLLAFWDGKSKGTQHMIATAKRHKLSVMVIEYPNKPVSAVITKFFTV